MTEISEYDEGRVVVHPGSDVVGLGGVLDVFNAAGVRARLLALLRSRPLMTLDLDDVTILTAAGVRLLEEVRQAARAAGTELRIVVDEKRPAHHVLRRTGSLDLLDPGADDDLEALDDLPALTAGDEVP
ncbi:MAG: STAS domain-containing protein, partial [Nocardioidaceae bacterium]|nr:STAS domain-containing protein [Nocardioidaceae bacterium]